MKSLSPEKANRYLSTLGMKIGGWNELAYIEEQEQSNRKWFNYRAPRDALALYSFSALMTDWLPRGDWKILQFDNSNDFPRVTELLLSRVLGTKQPIDLTQTRTFIFEYTNDENRIQNEVVITGLIYFLLVFEGHAYMVSSADSGYRLGIQDGFIYFQGKEEALARGREILKRFEDGGMADWQSDVEATWQESRIIG